MTMLIGSCAKDLPAPVVVDTACSWVRIIYLTDHDIDVLDVVGGVIGMLCAFIGLMFLINFPIR